MSRSQVMTMIYVVLEPDMSGIRQVFLSTAQIRSEYAGAAKKLLACPVVCYLPESGRPVKAKTKTVKDYLD